MTTTIDNVTDQHLPGTDHAKVKVTSVSVGGT